MIERELGFVDTPNAIQCRKCGKIKLNRALNFRQVRSGKRLVTMCIPCEKKDHNRSTTAALARQIRDKASIGKYGGAQLTDDERLQLLDQKLPELKARHTANRSAAAKARHDTVFHAQWALVRHLVSLRRSALLVRVYSLGWAGPKWASSAPQYPDVHAYLTLVLSIYQRIGISMSRKAGWYDVIGAHRPPPAWLGLAQSVRNIEGISRANMPRGHVSALITQLSPWVFTLPDERQRCLQALPPPDRWASLSTRLDDMTSTVLHHAIPWVMPPRPDGTRPAWDDIAACPPWLRIYNGLDERVVKEE